MKIYVARHGQTLWNTQNRICGRTDLELTKKGIEQAHILAEALKGEPVDVLICSSMKRARQTAGIVGEALGLDPVPDDRLIEQDYGIYEGMPRDTQAFLDNKRQFASAYPSGESQLALAARIYPLMDEIRAKYAGKNVLIVCHGGVCRMIRTYFMPMTVDEFTHYSPSNCDFAVYDA